MVDNIAVPWLARRPDYGRVDMKSCTNESWDPSRSSLHRASWIHGRVPSGCVQIRKPTVANGQRIAAARPPKPRTRGHSLRGRMIGPPLETPRAGYKPGIRTMSALCAAAAQLLRREGQLRQDSPSSSSRDEARNKRPGDLAFSFDVGSCDQGLGGIHDFTKG